MKIVVMCSDGPHNKYLVSEINKMFKEVKVFIEPGKAQANLKLAKKKYKQYLQLMYQMIRRKVCGMNKFRTHFFEEYISEFSYTNYETLFVNNINDKIVSEEIRTYKPDVAIVMGTSILHKEILHSMGDNSIINIHGGYLPYYKGNHCFFFAFYNKEFNKIGSTLHFIDNSIDTGDIIERVCPTIEKKDTPESLYCKAEKMAVDKLIELLIGVQKGKKLPREKQEKIGRLYYTKDRKLRYDLALLIRGIKGEE